MSDEAKPLTLQELTDFCIEKKIKIYQDQNVRLEFDGSAFVKRASIAEILKAQAEQAEIDEKTREEEMFHSAI